jgi:hypothetical protein
LTKICIGTPRTGWGGGGPGAAHAGLLEGVDHLGVETLGLAGHVVLGLFAGGHQCILLGLVELVPALLRHQDRLVHEPQRVVAGLGQALDLLVDAVGDEAAGAGVGGIEDAGLHRLVDRRTGHRRNRRAGTDQHLLERGTGGTGHLALHRIRTKDAVLLRCETAGEPRIGEHHDTGVVDDLLDVVHEGRLVQAQRMVMVLDQARHQRGGELRVTATGVVERERRDVELALDHRAPLLLRFEQRLAGIDLDVEVDVGRGGLLGNDLYHLVACVALAAGPLVRGLEVDGVGGSGEEGGGGEHGGAGRQFLEGFHRSVSPEAVS